jgi:hypothetical protein
LLNALGIDSLENRIKLIQSSAFSRLLDNEYTFEVVTEIIKSSNNRLHCRSVLRDLSKFMSANTKLSSVAARCRIINENLQRNFKFKCQRSQKVTLINHWLHNYEKHKENVIASCIAFI